MRVKLALVAALALMTGMAGAETPAQVPGPAPQQLMETTSARLLNALEADRETYRKDVRKLTDLVEAELLPHFDTEYTARLVLGKYWRDASPSQRNRFIKAFYHSLLGKYGTAVAGFTSDRMKMLPFQGDLASGRATVRTEIQLSDGTMVPVNYSLRATASGWKAWDVTIEGISYVKNFRNDIGAEVSQRGLDAVIARLEAEARAGGLGS
ncbi:MAG: MlaC/ttg2D family ABC transporter substrate-binding protein [Steroidobacteraceae bacterium]